jgi:hypothetical protein
MKLLIHSTYGNEAFDTFHVRQRGQSALDTLQVAAAAQDICSASWGQEGDASAQMKNAM